MNKPWEGFYSKHKMHFYTTGNFVLCLKHWFKCIVLKQMRVCGTFADGATTRVIFKKFLLCMSGIQILSPWLGDLVGSGVRQVDNPMPESTISPSQGIWLLDSNNLFLWPGHPWKPPRRDVVFTSIHLFWPLLMFIVQEIWGPEVWRLKNSLSRMFQKRPKGRRSVGPYRTFRRCVWSGRRRNLHYSAFDRGWTYILLEDAYGQLNFTSDWDR